MSKTFETLPGTLDAVWQRLARGVADRRAPARHPVLATAGQNGGAAARVVVLRAADRANARIEVHTDTASGKIAEVTADPACALVVWDPRAQVQIRLTATASILSGADAAGRWARIPEGARTNYGGAPAPGTPLADPAEHRPGATFDRFAVLDLRIDAIETLHLGRDRHRRARFERADGFAGRWIAP
ncbi:pyridoxamine 5'-phosphate oxidase family protein [Palleronia sp. KMU-117]|uniref:pyridoxamine 5'-phosphate oxidase family protein n=1 Tax=Palleronia sp. KMU-117 TaxID=3434108 RepID=UPI003D729F4B